MSSNEEDYNDSSNLSAQGLKKRKIQRACDICRRKKIRCDGVQMPRNRCSNCVSYSLDCTYVEASKKRGPPKGYVESLENRVEKLDKLLRKLIPDPTLFKELQDSLENEQAPFNPSPLVTTQQQPVNFHGLPASPIDKIALAIRSTTNVLTPPGDLVDEDTSVLADNLKRLALTPTPYRFFGKSSGAVLVQAAVELKQEYTQSAEPLSNTSKKPAFSASRTEFWRPRHWESGSDQIIQSPQYTFPDPDLASNLVDLYFSNINLYFPLLHRPAFEKSVADGLHYKDELFASTYLLVCAAGSRYSDDPRVLLEGDDSLHSSGWKWFDQVQMMKKSMLSPPTLYDLQFYCLSVHFLQGSSAPQSCWTMVGIGIRLAQDVGAHRRKDPQHTLTAEDEQWKRGFWVLVCMDRLLSASLGRPCATNDEDFDVDLPIDCDDEYWDHPDPDQRFKQPANEPSLTAAFILFIQLNQILSYCLRTIYAINKSKILLGYAGQQWEQAIVAELDSALNKWVDSVPDHLRWDPHRENMVFFNQSASLYSLYYHLQILIHRPFIPSPTKPLPFAFPSLAICTNAARSCTHITDIYRRRSPLIPLHCAMAMFTSGIVLLLSIWGGKRSGLSLDPHKEMTDVHKCMKTLKILEKRWRSIGRLWDVLYELASVGDLPLPEPSPLATNKREWDSDTPKSVASSESPQPMSQDDAPRIIAGSRRMNKDFSGSKRAGHSRHPPNQQQQHPQQLPTSSSSTSHLMQLSHHQQHPDRSNSMTSSVPCTPTYTLPVHSDELGRLPLHGHLNFSTQTYLDPTNYWYQNVANSGVDGSGASEGNANSDHIVLSDSSRSSSLSHLSNRRQHQQPQEHNLVQSPHNNYPYSTTETSTVTQAFPLDPTIGTGNGIFDPMSLTYMPPASYASVPPSMNLVSPQNPVGGRGRSLHPSFRGVSMALTSNLGGVVGRGQEFSQPPSHREQSHHQHHHHHTQGQREHDIHGNHHHREQQQQQQPMGYPYVDNDTIAMWSTAPTGFELDEWGAYLSNMNQLAQGGQGDSGQIQQ